MKAPKEIYITTDFARFTNLDKPVPNRECVKYIRADLAEKDTTQRALDWLMAHTKSYAGPIKEPFWAMFIEHFKKAMEEE